MPYSEITVRSDGYVGSPGWTKFHFNDTITAAAAATAAAAVKAFLGALVAYFPSGMNFTFLPTYQIHQDDGLLLAEVAYTPIPAVTAGGGTGAYAGGSGACVFWNTAALNGGHKVRGRTYLVPCSNAAYDNTGTLGAPAVTAMQNAANTLVGGSIPLGVNSRDNGKAGRTNLTALVTSATVPDRSAFLRSRRS